MKERILLASFVLFKELYDNNTDIYDVVAEFIKGAMVFAQKRAFDATEINQLISEHFGLSIPEAVITTTLRNRLVKRDGFLISENGAYVVASDLGTLSTALQTELKNLELQQEVIVERLLKYADSQAKRISEQERQAITNAFCDYLFGNTIPPKYSKLVSTFIITTRDTPYLTEMLDAVREGSVLYDGVRYSPDLGSQNWWRKELSVYLDTEHLFNAVGFNGQLHKQLFRDFYELSSEVRLKGKRQITLWYFDECKAEVEKFFYVAELIIDRQATLDPSKPAMLSILDGCSTRADVVAKKAKFYDDLRKLRIGPAELPQDNPDLQFNIENAHLLDTVRKEYRERGWRFDEQKCVNTLQMLSKVNAQRRGVNNTAFEDIGHVFVSGSLMARYLAFHEEIKAAPQEIPLATDLEYITNRLWFRLSKGLTKRLSTPRSLSVLAKAQVILSTQINTAIGVKFDAVRKDFESGKLGKSEAEDCCNDLRARAGFPEEISAERLAAVGDVLSHEGYEHHIREKSVLKQQVALGEQAISELATLKRGRRRQLARNLRVKSIARLSALAFLMLFGLLLVYYLGYGAIERLAEAQDSQLARLGVFSGPFLFSIAYVIVGGRFFMKWAGQNHRRFIRRGLKNDQSSDL